MMKKLLFIAALCGTTMLNAQSGRIAKHRLILNMPSTGVVESKTSGSLPVTCYTITTITGTVLDIGTITSDTSVPGCSPLAGYSFGSNCFKDMEKANFFGQGYYSSVTSPSVSSVRMTFY